MKQIKNIKVSISGIFLLLLFLLVSLIFIYVPNGSIQYYIEKSGPLAPAIYILLTTISYVVTPIDASPLMFTGIYLFNKTFIFYFAIAVFISSIINFWIARIYGRKIVVKLLGKNNVIKLDKFSGNYVTILFFRLFQGGLNDIVSYAAGLTNIQFVPYLIISTIGSIPGLTIWYFMAGYMSNPFQFVFISIVTTLTFSSLYLLIYYFRNKTHRI